MSVGKAVAEIGRGATGPFCGSVCNASAGYASMENLGTDRFAGGTHGSYCRLERLLHTA